jgi:hypothetical protein
MEQLLERTLDGIGQIAMHEAGALDNHVLALREHWAVARRARGVGEFLRDQLDLLPALRLRLAEQHELRMKLWRGLAGRPDSAA